MSFLPGLDDAIKALAAGCAVVVPNPSPQSYGVVATAPHVVNAARGRPIDQAAGSRCTTRVGGAAWSRASTRSRVRVEGT